MKNRSRVYALLIAGGLLLGSLCLYGIGQREQLTPLSEAPVAPKGTEIGDLLRKWYANGTAAGNTGDYYDNRDGGHSLLDLAPYPQLQKVEYTEEQIKARQHWGRQQQVLPFVVFGNSSTSAPPESSGSNVRSYYTDPRGLLFLFAEYAANNLYIYPEHMDHDPGHNGSGGYGDLLPTNTPYLITSQGSSGTDQPFMKALPYVLAAFHPEVKKKLIQSGLLMPTIQMILRVTGKQLSGTKDYLTGKAHPSVFSGDYVNALAMVEMAHGITLSNLPPIAVIRVVKEEAPVNGVDYFEPGYTEHLGDTPSVMARVFRGAGNSRKLVISAEGSRDVNKRPLKYHWAILRGDSNRIKIDYLNTEQSVAEITIPYQPRKPIGDNPTLESNRVDIGIFVHNGVYYSPPAFLTYYSLDNESRTYRADGQPVDIGYGAGSCQLSITNWLGFFDLLEPGANTWASRFLQSQFKPEELAALIQVATDFRKQHQAFLDAQSILEKTDKGEPGAIQAASKAVEDAKQAESQILQRKILKSNLAASEFIQRALTELMRNPNLWRTNASDLGTSYRSADIESKDALDQVRKKLVQFGVAENVETPHLRVKMVQSGALTDFEWRLLQEFNGTLISRLIFPGVVEVKWRENYVDFRLAAKKDWRDIYSYSPNGIMTGWRRLQPEGVTEFNSEGAIILEKDAQGRCIRGRAVRYESEPDKRDSNGLARRVKLIPTDTIHTYEYAGPDDWKGRVRP